jgi:hypothetical protein
VVGNKEERDAWHDELAPESATYIAGNEYKGPAGVVALREFERDLQRGHLDGKEVRWYRYRGGLSIGVITHSLGVSYIYKFDVQQYTTIPTP